MRGVSASRSRRSVEGDSTSYTLDPGQGLLYLSVGNPGPDFTNNVRTGQNLYTNAILILDAKTGIYRHHYSVVPADFHDWDLAAAPVLVTTKGDVLPLLSAGLCF